VHGLAVAPHDVRSQVELEAVGAQHRLGRPGGRAAQRGLEPGTSSREPKGFTSSAVIGAIAVPQPRRLDP
jgi:hypothetical protein